MALSLLAIMQEAGSTALPVCKVPGPLDWPTLLYTIAYAVAIALIAHVTQVTRRLDKEVRNGGE